MILQKLHKVAFKIIVKQNQYICITFFFYSFAIRKPNLKKNLQEIAYSETLLQRQNQF